MHVMAPCLRRRCSHTYKPKNWLDFLRKLVLVSIQICLFTGHLVLTVFSVWSVSHSGAHIITTRRHFSHSRIPKVHMNFSCDPLATSVCTCVCVSGPDLLVHSRGTSVELKVGVKGRGYEHSVVLFHKLTGWQRSSGHNLLHCFFFFLQMWSRKSHRFILLHSTGARTLLPGIQERIF